MNPSKKSTRLFTAMTLGMIVAFSGCTTTGMQHSTDTRASMKTVEHDIHQSDEQVAVTDASLEDLITPGQTDIKEAFKKYSDNVDKMEKLGKLSVKHADKMSAEGKDYFSEWRTTGNSYTNPDIQALSEQRRADMTAVFAKISVASVGVKGNFKSYLSDIKQIQSYLSNDLTPKGVEAITPVAHKAIDDGDNLRASVTPVLSAISKARSELAQGGTK